MPEFRVGIGVDAHAFATGCRWCSAASPSTIRAGSSATPTATSSPTRSPTPFWVRPGLGTSARSSLPTTTLYRGADSLVLLADAYARVRAAGFELVNADCVLIGEEPRIAALREEMSARLAGALSMGADRVAVRATTTDHLGFTGRGEGAATQAVALLPQEPPEVRGVRHRFAGPGLRSGVRLGRPRCEIPCRRDGLLVSQVWRCTRFWHEDGLTKKVSDTGVTPAVRAASRQLAA